MATIRNFEVISDPFNIIKTCNGGNYAQGWKTNTYNRQFIFLIASSYAANSLKGSRRQKSFAEIRFRYLVECKAGLNGRAV